MIHSTAVAPSQSRLATLHHCQRKYWYKYACGLDAKHVFAPAHAGKAAHAALDTWHRTGSVEHAEAAAADAWAGTVFHGDFDWLTLGHLLTVLRGYFAAKHTQDWQVVKLRMEDMTDALVECDAVAAEDGYLALAEASFIVNVPGMGMVNLRPDLLLQGASGYRIVDHKFTTAYLGNNIYIPAKHTHQLRLYALGMSALLGKPVLEGMVNAVYMGKTAASDKFKGQRYDSYVFDYSPADFEETKAWYAAGVLRMRDIEEHFAPGDELHAPQNPGKHCSSCDYAPLCIKPPVMRPGLMAQLYTTKEAS